MLRSSFQFGKDEVLITLSSLFSVAELTFESECALEVALQLLQGLGGLRRRLYVALATQADEPPL